MCKFRSGVFLRARKQLLSLPFSDSHSEIMDHYGIKDDCSFYDGRFVRVEVIPDYTQLELGRASKEDIVKNARISIEDPGCRGLELYKEAEYLPDWVNDSARELERQARELLNESLIYKEHVSCVSDKSVEIYHSLVDTITNSRIAGASHSAILHINSVCSIGEITSCLVGNLDGLCYGLEDSVVVRMRGGGTLSSSTGYVIVKGLEKRSENTSVYSKMFINGKRNPVFNSAKASVIMEHVKQNVSPENFEKLLESLDEEDKQSILGLLE